MNKLSTHWLATYLLLILLYSYGSAADMASNSPDSTIVCGQIASNTTWTLAGSPFVVTCNVLVNSGATLTIEPGVIVKFSAGRAITIDGTLVARGTVQDSIVFTSGQTNPAPGDWGYILFTDLSTDAMFDQAGVYTGGSVLEYCTVEYAGGTSLSNNGAIRADNAHPFIYHCQVHRNSTTGLYAWNLSGNLRVFYSAISENERTPSSGVGNGAGIAVIGKHESEIVTITGCSIRRNVNVTGAGGGIYAEMDGINISNCILDSNIAIGSGGGICVGNGMQVSISHNEITRNMSTYEVLWPPPLNGGGIYINAAWGVATISENNISGNLASGSAGGIYIAGGNVTISRNIIRNNQDLDDNPVPPICGAGIRVTDGNADIFGNHIIHNRTEGNGGGIYVSGGSAIIHQNVLAGNSAKLSGGGICVIGGTAEIFKNSIVRNSASQYPAINYCCSDSIITYNLILGNKLIQGPTPDSSSTIHIEASSHPSFSHNNVFGNACVYDLRNDNIQGSGDLSANNNWWGRSMSSEIDEAILDYFDDASKSIVQYSPYLGTLDVEAPIAPPTKPVLAPYSDHGIIVTWNANAESDLAGYRVYYGTTSRFPYTDTIDVGNHTVDTLKNLTSGTIYYIAVTAYDDQANGNDDQIEGHESWYSEEASFQPPDVPKLAFPSNGATDLDTALTLIWQSIQNVLTYRVQLATDPDFLTVFVDDSTVVDTTKSVEGLAVGVIHYWRVSSENLGGASPWSSVWQFISGTTVDVGDRPNEIPRTFSLDQNFPNPFNPATTINYSIPKRTFVTIEVVNVLGERVQSLINETKAAGLYQITWDGQNAVGRAVSSGVYFYRIQAGDFVETKKMLLLK